MRPGLLLRSGAALTAGAGLLLLAGCGADDGAAAGSGPDGGDPDTTVTIRDADGTDVLADPSGLTLYTSDQEQGTALCTSDACTAIWEPLTVPKGEQPTATGQVSDELGTLTRADGSRQVTLDGRPLYTFSLDHGPGHLNGEGQEDSFDGTDFVWHAATPSGSAPATDMPGGPGYGY